MEIVRLTSGLIAHHLTEGEQNRLWDELSVDISPIGKSIELFTPRDNKGYFIVSETKIKHDTYKSVIRANGKTFNIKYNVCNQDEVTYKAVRNAYLKTN